MWVTVSGGGPDVRRSPRCKEISRYKEVSRKNLCFRPSWSSHLISKFIHSVAADSTTIMLHWHWDPASLGFWYGLKTKDSQKFLRPSVLNHDCWDTQSCGLRSYQGLSLSNVKIASVAGLISNRKRSQHNKSSFSMIFILLILFL